MKRNQLKFLHIADLHLGRELVGGRLKLPYEKASVRVRELRDILLNAIELARSEAVEVILIAGDLWEEGGIGTEDVNVVIDYLGKAGVPVVIAPGNHDYHSPASHYNESLVEARFQVKWPPNVHIFRDYDFTSFTIPELEGVSFTGLAYKNNQPVIIRRLSERIDTPPSDIKIAVIHGSRDDHLPQGKLRTLPFTDTELLSQPFDYTALGHYHTRTAIPDAKGKIRAAYSGAAAALTLNETGECGALIGIAKPGGVEPEELIFKPLDSRRIHHLKVDVTGLTHTQAIEAKIAELVANNDVKPADILFAELSGTYPLGNRIFLSDEFCAKICWHIRVDADDVMPEWSLDTLGETNPRTTEGLFVARIRSMMDEAAKRGDELERKRLLRALQYGLDALHGRQVSIRG